MFTDVSIINTAQRSNVMAEKVNYAVQPAIMGRLYVGKTAVY